MPKAKGPADILQVARLFYNDELSKNSIAKKMGIDPRTVNVALKRARETGMVEIKIRETAFNKSLEDQLIEKYPHLKRVLTLPTLGPITTAEQHAEIVRRMGELAADYFEEYMNQQRGPVHVALSGGVSVLETVNAILPKDRPNLFIHVTALVGYGAESETHNHLIPAVNVSILWAKSGKHPGDHLSYATVPPLPNDLDALAQIPSIKAALADMEKINIAFVAPVVVNLDRNLAVLHEDDKTLRNQLSTTTLLPPHDRRALAKAKAVAFFSYQPIDKDGNAAMDPNSAQPKALQYFLSGGYGTDHPGVDFYKRLVKKGRTVVALGGPFKLPAIKAALKGKLMNVWVTDEDTARTILTKGD